MKKKPYKLSKFQAMKMADPIGRSHAKDDEKIHGDDPIEDSIQDTPKEGFYYLKTKDGSEEPTLVHGYHCTDFGGDFVYGFNTHDGGGLIRHCELIDNVIVVPVRIVEDPTENI